MKAVLKADKDFEDTIAQVPKVLTIILENTTSFRFEPMPPLAAITVRKRGNYWFAYRKYEKNVRNFYLGKIEDVTYNKLKDAAEVLSKNNEQYEETIKERKQVRQNKKYTTNDASEGRVRELEDQMAAIQTERDELLRWQEKYKPVLIKARDIRDQLQELGAKIKNKEKGYAPNSASQLMAELKIILAAMEAPNE